MQDLSVMLSQHDEEVDSEANDDEERYKNIMDKPLFDAEEDEEDFDSDDDEAKRKGVHWGADVADH